MGKKKSKDPEKRAALQLKKEAKANKAARKRLQKEAKSQGQEEENVDELLEAYRQQDAKVETTVLEPLQTSFPPPRANSTLTLVPDKNNYLYLFGGEYYDGVENIVLDELLRWDTNKGEWKRFVTPAPRPPPRCAHSTVYYRNALYVFGGEMATADQYHHYRDLWRFDLTTQTWEEIRSTKGTCPTARSGHMAVVWKQYIIVFGGFYEALRDTRWYNDVCVMDLQTHTWLDMPHSKLATRPEPRSACNVGLFGDVAIVHGGFCKSKNPTTKAETKVHTDCWMLHLKPILQGRLPTWERVSIRSSNNASAFTPNSRSGTASLPYKNRLLVYGGVIDKEEYHHRVDSVFYNDLFAFDVERRKWFPLRVKPQSADGKARRRRKKSTENGEEEDMDQGNVEPDNDSESSESSDLEEEDVEDNQAGSGWDLDMLRSNMFAFVDGDGNIVYEKIQEEEEEEKEETKEAGDGYAADTGEVSKIGGQEEQEEEESEEEKEEEKEEDTESQTEAVKANNGHAPATAPTKGRNHMDVAEYTVSSSSVMTMNKETGAPEPVARNEPLPRINSCMVVQGHTLFIYGGVLEVGDREVTLDDCWTFDLRKRDKWTCVWEGTMHKQVWRGATHDDDDSYVSNGAGEDDDSEDEESDGEPLEQGEETGDAEKKAAEKSKKSKQSGLKQEITELKEKLDLDDPTSTPQMGEAMADFYARTSEHWNQQAVTAVQGKLQTSEGEALSSKELKREGFNLARERYDELRPLLDRLNELDLQQQEAEEERKSRKSEKDKKKKDKEKKKERRNR